MFKKTVVVLVCLILGFLLFNTAVSKAQEGELTKVKSEAIELDMTSFFIPCEDPDDPDCVAYPDNTAHPVPGSLDHEIELNNIGFPPSTDVYIVGCINTPNGTACTTGEKKLDKMLNDLPGGDMMSQDPTHEFKALTNPAKTDVSGNLKVIVRSYTPQVTHHSFNAYLVTEQDLQPTSIGIGPSVTPEESLHLQTFTHTTPAPSPVQVSPRKVHRRFKDLDPKGRTFDIVSLEPIAGVETTLLDSYRNLFKYKKIINPQLVQENGEFNFWVPNGIYYLQFAKLPETHNWPVEMDKVHENYSLAYYCDPDVKDSENMTVPLYYEQFSIIEFNKLVHCDVPLDPGNNPPIRTPVKTLNYGLEKNKIEEEYNFTGKVTHPLTKIQLVGQNTQKIVKETEADKLGFWQTTLSADSYPLDEKGLPDKIVLRYIKKDLTAKNTFEPVGGMVFEPLLSYVEGYAYDENNNIIANAKVGIKQKNNDNVVYLTKANSKGYFKIGSQYLPSYPYDLIFTPEEGDSSSELVSSSQFLARNKEYLTTKKLNLVATENKDVPLAISTTASFTGLKNKNLASSSDSIAKPTDEVLEPKKQQAGMATGLVLILIVMVAISGLLIYFFKRKTPTSLPPNSL